MGIKYDSIDYDVLNKAKLILSRKACVKEYTETCIEAGVCPKCGKEGLEMDEYSYWECSSIDCGWHQNS